MSHLSHHTEIAFYRENNPEEDLKTERMRKRKIDTQTEPDPREWRPSQIPESGARARGLIMPKIIS